MRGVGKAGLFALALGALAPPAGAAGETTPLMAFLAAAPDDAEMLGAPMVLRFADIDALTADYARATPALTIPTDDDQLRALTRLRSGMDFTRYLNLSLPVWRTMLGFDWADMAWIGQVGAPPRTLTVFGVDPAITASQVGAALSARGYETRDGEPVVWRRRDDGQVNLAERDPADPFGGWLGLSARVALAAPGVLVGTVRWAEMDAALDALGGTAPALAQRADFAALSRALHDSRWFEGAPLQVLITNDLPPRETPLLTLGPNAAAEDGAALQDMLDDGGLPGVLPVYRLAAFADVNVGGGGAAAALALVYGDKAQALQAEQVMRQRLAVYEPRSFQQPLSEVFAGGVDGFVSSGALRREAVAVLVLRMEDAPTAGAETAASRGRAYGVLVDLFTRRDVAFLAVGE